MKYYIGKLPVTPYLEHFGIPGMKWGVKNGPPYPLDENKSKQEKLMEINTKTKSGQKVTLGQRPTPKFTQFISKYFPSVKENITKDKQFNIVVDGKKIGDLEIFKEAEDSLNVVWVGIDNSERGKGYAQATMKAVVKYAKQQKFSQITLEVPGNSPDARHIYEKLGFKATKVLSEDDDVWGGLTQMVNKL